ADDPFCFADMDAAVDRIQRAIDVHEPMAVYGDYDADGVTSTALLYTYLREKGADVSYYIPDREEGYGLHKESIDRLHQQGVRLIVTVDNGISAVEEIAYAAGLGMEVVVTDHHQPQETLPPAAAVVDPHRPDCGSECKDYAGVGVAFKLACALEGDAEPILERFGDLVAIGTLGDVMPLRGENRALVRAGLRVLNEGKRPGLASLAREAGLEGKELSATNVVFALVPRLNAAGRMASPDQAARLLMTGEETTAAALAGEIQQCNVRRQAAEGEILRQVQERLQNDPRLLADRVLVIDGEGWHPGVVGIIAARLLERYGKPCILLTKKDGEAKGSGRSVKGFSLFEAISACSDLLTHFGGHELAAGVGLPAESIPAFREKINRFAAERCPQMPVPELRLDFKLRPSQVDVEKLNLLKALEPMGAGNPSPVFGLFRMRLDNITPLSGGKHVRMSVSRDGVRLSVLKFGTAYEEFPFECGQLLNLAVTLERNEYRGVVTPTVLAREIRAAELDQEELILALQQFDGLLREEAVSPEQAAAWTPERAELERVYRYLRTKKSWNGALEQLCYFLEQPRISYIRLRVALETLRQAGLIGLADQGDSLRLTLLPVGGKVNLEDTPVLRRLRTAERG
ncbi:MAG TPA: single-stranded-DNA-specific exonuclease RecJ, partial [Firmicutes bacterium]|nr:single-stranded-DNA-specific exonuclease RecJ [Bacillota bacterium]